ncbi:glycosyltransferase [Weissella minor]|uniref:Glycosyl transferase family 1 domain-containing protein n=1 Tax=Weissella minor TaxID=1620 RepID=A0A0R2JI62_9LACO|nr:glycosyltransferase [Weissella minor]KRN76971.1 hypothetical protein IV67_GL000483 [Weissella minor]
MKKVYMLVHGIALGKGGMTSAMLVRSHYFYNHNIQGDLVTLDYNPDYPEIIATLKKNKMDERTNMINMFQYFDQDSLTGTINDNQTEDSYLQTLETYIKIPKDNTARFFDKDTGNYACYVRFEGNHIKIIDEMNNAKRSKRIHFINGLVSHIEYFNENNKKHYEVFFNAEGHPYLSRQCNAKTGTIGSCFVLSRNKHFANNIELSQYFLNDIVDDETSIICDGPGSFRKILGLENKNVKLFAVLHARHFENWADTKTFKPDLKFILDNADKIDGVITLTEGQKQDIQRDFNIQNIYTIPNFITLNSEPDHTYGSKVVGTISRFSKEKGFDRMLDVAKIVSDLDPTIQFHLYGSGNYLDPTAAKIKKLHLENSVTLKGYTSNPIKTLQDFDLVISASHYEGQGLSMIEAMEQKVPVVAFDIQYGPSDFINDQQNSYLIDDGDINAMAIQIVKALNTPDQLEKMGLQARKDITAMYNPDNIMSKWHNILN